MRVQTGESVRIHPALHIWQANEICLTIRDRLPRDENGGSSGQELTDRVLHSGTFEELEAVVESFVRASCRLYQQGHGDYLENWVRHYISNHYRDACSAEEMAEQLRMSPNYLRRKFKEATGQTLLEYLTDVRLTMATQLLKHRSNKVKEVSLQVGYENVSYFTHLFVKKYGVTPNEYKKIVQ